MRTGECQASLSQKMCGIDSAKARRRKLGIGPPGSERDEGGKEGALGKTNRPVCLYMSSPDSVVTEAHAGASVADRPERLPVSDRSMGFEDIGAEKLTESGRDRSAFGQVGHNLSQRAGVAKWRVTVPATVTIVYLLSITSKYLQENNQHRERRCCITTLEYT